MRPNARFLTGRPSQKAKRGDFMTRDGTSSLLAPTSRHDDLGKRTGLVNVTVRTSPGTPRLDGISELQDHFVTTLTAEETTTTL